MPRKYVLFLAFTALPAIAIFSACQPQATGKIALDPGLSLETQLDQYRRDAEATGTARAVQAAADLANVQATAAHATHESIVLQATLGAAATAAESRRLAHATATAVHERRATETAAAQSTATAVALAQATHAQQIETTRVALAFAAEAARLEHERLVNSLTGLLLFMVAVVVVVLMAWLGLVAIQAWRKRMSVVTHGPFGAPLLILDGPRGQQVIVDPQRLFGPAAVIDARGLVTAPELTHPLLQERTTALAQRLAMQQASHHPFFAREAARMRAPHDTAMNPSATPEPHLSWDRDTPQPAPSLRVEAPWQLIHSWHGGGLPLGMAEAGMLIIDPEAFPHFLFAGTTGSGKTRFGLRPLITSALADGWHVSIFDRSGLDFKPFQAHPNASLVLLDDPPAAIDFLASLYDVVQARFHWMMKVGASTWSRAPHRRPPRVLAVFDEFSNLADSLTGRQREDLWRYARMVAAEGRKAGVHLAIALQDPTHRSLDLRIRRNCVPLSFRVKDTEASRVVLGTTGAEALPPRQFLTVLHDLTRAVAFAPDDEQIASFLATRRVPIYARPDWAAN